MNVPDKKMRFLGVDIGGTKCAVCVGDYRGRVLSRHEIATGEGPDETLAVLTQHAHDLFNQFDDIEAVGIVCGGPLNVVDGLVLSPPNLPGWDEVPIVDHFCDRFHVPTFLQNDANAGALAEWLHGAGKGCRNMMFCTMGTGFGCGLILDGKLHEGANGNAGELGHVRLTPGGPVGYGKAGSVEGYCGGGGIAQLASMRLDEHTSKGGTSILTGLETVSAKSVAEAAMNGDALSLQIFAEVGTMLGRALSLAIDLLNLERVVIGSIFTRCEELIRPTMDQVMREECLAEALEACSVTPAVLGEGIGDVAALTVAQVGLERTSHRR